MVSTPKCYMHKQSIEVLRDKGALIADTDLVCFICIYIVFIGLLLCISLLMINKCFEYFSTCQSLPMPFC